MPIDTPTLEIEDAADGGGVMATIDGGDPAATNVVRYARVTGELGEIDWTTLDSKTGDGEIEGTVARKGFHFFHCVSTLGSESVISNLVFQKVTDGDDAMHEQIIQAVEDRAAIALAGTEFSVQRMKIPFPQNITVPACVVSAFEMTETDEGGTSGHDYVGRAVGLSLVTNDAHDEDTESPVHLARQLLFRAFHSQRLPGVDEVMRCVIEPSPVMLLEEVKGVEYQESPYILRCVVREPRGLGV